MVEPLAAAAAAAAAGSGAPDDERAPLGPHRRGSWAAGDHQSLDDAWQDTIVDLGSQWGQYEYVTNVGFGA